MTFTPTKPREPGTTKAAVSALYDQAGGIPKVAFLIGRSESVAHSYSDPEESTEISFDFVRRITLATGATAAAEDLAALIGGVFLPCRGDGETFAVLAAKSAKEWGEFTAMLLTATASGTLAQCEPTIRRELDDVIRVLACARAQLIAGEGRL